MTEHFTSPALADTLARFGIVKETPFYWQPETNSSFAGHYLCATDSMDKEASITLDWLDVNPTGIDNKPAYLLTEVLKWLPETVKLEDLEYDLHQFYDYENGLTVNYHHFSPQDDMQYISNMNFSPEEAIIKGLTEGWLTKEIIEQAIKDNV